jgi:hypothetical protein
MNQQSSTIDRVRQLMGPGNPVPAGTTAGSWDDKQGQQAYQRIVAMTGAGDGTHGWLGGPARPARRAWRVLAPAGAGLAVVALVAGLIIVGGSHAKQPDAKPPLSAAGTIASKVPAFYVTISGGSRGYASEMVAQVHSSQTGQILSQVAVGKLLGGVGNGVAAEPSPGDFLIWKTLGSPTGEVVTWQLSVSRDGRSLKLMHLPLVLLPRGSRDYVEGAAVSPDGSQVAAVLSPSSNSLAVHDAIRVYPLAGGATRTWTAPRDPGLAWSPVWTSDHQLTFVWQDHLRGSAEYFYVGRSQVRVLDTSAPGHNLLAARVLATEGGKFSLIQSLGAGSGDSPVVVAAIHVTSLGGHGTQTRQLAELSPSGSIMKVVAGNSVSYSSLEQEGLLSASCQVFATTPDGAMLAENPDFGRIVNGKFSPLADSAGTFSAAW